MLGYVAFFAIHIGQVIRAGWPNLRSMVSGYDLVEVPAGAERQDEVETTGQVTHGD